MENLRVIDVSEHQGTINWDAVKGHIDGAILRCGYGDNIASQDDKQWKRNADECTRLGIPFGVYIYSYATSDAQAKSEAEHVLRNFRTQFIWIWNRQERKMEQFKERISSGISSKKLDTGAEFMRIQTGGQTTW